MRSVLSAGITVVNKYAAAAAAKLLQSCLILCDPIDSPPGSSVPGILQARTPGSVAISFSKYATCPHLTLCLVDKTVILMVEKVQDVKLVQ